MIPLSDVSLESAPFSSQCDEHGAGSSFLPVDAVLAELDNKKIRRSRNGKLYAKHGSVTRSGTLNPPDGNTGVERTAPYGKTKKASEASAKASEASAKASEASVPFLNSFKGLHSEVRIDYLAFTLWNFPLSPEKIAKRNSPAAFVTELMKVLDLWHDFVVDLPDICEEEMERFIENSSAVDEIECENVNQISNRWTVDMLPGFLGSSLALEEKPRGLKGYSKQHVLGKAQILSQGAPGMGIHVILSGDACSELSIDPLLLIKRIIATKGNVARLDLAIDDYSGRLDIRRMIEDTRAGLLTTRCQEAGVYESFGTADGKQRGLTFYIGNRESDAYFRFYDKLLATLKELGIDKKNKKQIKALSVDLPEFWARAEVELKNDAAQKAARLLIPGGLACEDGSPSGHSVSLPDLVPRLLLNSLKFKQPSLTDSNRRRWPIADWWLEFLGTERTVSVSRAVEKTDMDKRAKWFERQCAPSMTAIAAAFGPDRLEEMFKEALQRQSPELKANQSSSLLLGSVTTLLFGLALSICIRR